MVRASNRSSAGWGFDPRLGLRNHFLSIELEDHSSTLRLVLENNFFEFDGKVFCQKFGTAIKTKFAPGFANIFMGYLKETFLDSCKLRPLVWWRFLDDVFMIWLHSEEGIDSFLASLNSFHWNIKYTWEIGYVRISFLDVLVTFFNGAVYTDVYSKPKDGHQYLNYESCHPPHIKRGINYGQALRLKRICNSWETFERQLSDLRGFLVRKGYNSDFVESQFSRLRSLNRSMLFNQGNGTM